jgi:hypothetical protein
MTVERAEHYRRSADHEWENEYTNEGAGRRT